MFQAEIERLKLEIEKAPRGGPFFFGEEHQYHQFSLKINDGQKTSKMMLYVEASKNEYTIYFGDVCTRTLL